MKSGQAFILVYSVTNQSSFDEVEDFRKQILRIKDVRDPSEVAIILCGINNEKEENRVVSKDEGEALAAEWEVPFFEVSTKSSADVEEVFVTAVRLTCRLTCKLQEGGKTNKLAQKTAKKTFFRRLKNCFGST